MKTSLIRNVCWVVALLGLGAAETTAQFISPNVAPPAAGAARAPVKAPAGTQLVTNTRDDGPGSLRYAISNAAPGDTIRITIRRHGIPAKHGIHSLAIIELKSSLTIDKDLTILGPGPESVAVARSFASHTPSFRVFSIEDGVVTISGLSILNGRAINPDGFSDNLGGGILNFGTLTLSNCVVSRNVAPMEGGGRGFGGGIFSVGALTLLNCTFSHNEASGAGGGVCTFHCPNLFAEGCTVNNNFAGVQGGGVNFHGTLGHLRNSTISGNETAPDGAASGLLHIVFDSEAAELAVSACTIARNHGTTNGAFVIAALPFNLGIATRMIGTLVADNQSPNFVFVGGPILQSLGHNLDDDGSSGLINGVNGDIVGSPAHPIDARLKPLHFNGGLTATHALRHGSPAIDAGACADANGAPLTIDQRGVPRPQGLSCDIGAFEKQVSHGDDGDDDENDDHHGDHDD
jgi:hypothetical protein